MTWATPSGALAGAWQMVRAFPGHLLVGAVRLYQLAFSSWSGQSCRYYPSCSAYAITAIRTHGAATGSALAASRVLRCNPWSRGGVDEVPPASVEATVFLRSVPQWRSPGKSKECAA
jgi:putative membrane protein insertion efficiency factor